ncbi:MAG: response regulator [Proteobacteria bacterium]|nr:response regulator [Pseudomonadota bacterium]
MPEKGQILIADNEDVFRTSITTLLRGSGYECDTASDAAQATEMLQYDNYDLIICDIQMPGNLELEFVRNIQHIAKGVSVILVTGSPSLDTAIDSVGLPVIAYLVKPVDTEALLVLVQKAIGRRLAYRTFTGFEERLKTWRTKLVRIGEPIADTTQDSSSMTIDTYLSLTLHNVVDCFEDLKNITEALSEERVSSEACHLLECPRLSSLTGAITETIAVLERTKGSFKSKELGQLRKRLKEIVVSLGPNAAKTRISPKA